VRDMSVVGGECKKRDGELRRNKTKSESGPSTPNGNGLVSQLRSIALDQYLGFQMRLEYFGITL
jgi:hypothetical protein